jgi:hypothetical protein
VFASHISASSFLFYLISRCFSMPISKTAEKDAADAPKKDRELIFLAFFVYLIFT